MSEQSIRYQAVVFDLDDTLFPADAYVRSGYAAVARYVEAVYGIHVGEDLLTGGLGDPDDAFRKVFHKRLIQDDEGFFTRITHVFLSHVPSLFLLPDAASALACLRSMGLALAVLAPGDPSVQRLKIRALGLQHLVDQIIFPGDLLGDRTSTEALHMITTLLEAPLSKILFVGNSTHSDFLPYLQLPMDLGVVRRPGPARAPPPPGQSFALSTLLDLPALMTGHAQARNSPCQTAEL